MSDSDFGLRPHRIAILVAMAAANVAWARGLADSTGAGEHLYLTLVATAVLLPVSALGPGSTAIVASSALLVTVAQWVLPPTGALAATLGLVLVATLAAAVTNALRRRGERPPWALTVPAALGLQALFRSDALLEPGVDVQTLAVLIGLPLAGGLAAAVIARRHGWRAFVGVAALLALGRGWDAAVTLAAVGLATTELLRAELLPRALRWVAPAALVAASAWWSPAFAVVLAAGMALSGERRPRWLPAAIAAACGVSLFVPIAPIGWRDAGAGLAWLALALPALPLARRDRWPRLALLLLLAVAVLRWLPPAAALAVPALLAALCLRGGSASVLLQRTWSATLLATAALAAAYPWLRPEPLPEAAGLFGLPPDLPGALLLPVALVALALTLDRLAPRLSSHQTVLAGAGVLTLAALVALPPRAALPLSDVVTLSAERPTWASDLPEAARVAQIVIDSQLSASTALVPGTPVARVELSSSDGRVDAWELQVGLDTGEWAARRPDVAALPGLAAPEPWISSVAPGGFFAQRYRALRQMRVGAAEGIRVTRLPDLPAEVTVSLFHVELRP